MDRQSFSQRLNDINAKTLKIQLPVSLARWVSICPTGDSDDVRFDFYSTESWPAAAKGGVYGIPLNPRHIELVEF